MNVLEMYQYWRGSVFFNLYTVHSRPAGDPRTRPLDTLPYENVAFRAVRYPIAALTCQLPRNQGTAY